MTSLALGTVQFGLQYGINNKTGKVKDTEAFKILDLCFKNGINSLDTSYYYGDSEIVLGKYLKDNSQFNLVSKLPSLNPEKTKDFFYQSLKRLQIKKLYGYLIHHFDYFQKNPEVYNTLEQLKSEKLVSKIGFSLYYPQELDYLLSNNIDFDIVQFPYNILDQRFLPYFKILKRKNVEIYIRSVFLQGLLLKKAEELEQRFIKIKAKISELNNISNKNMIPVSSLCLNFAMATAADKVIIGVDSIQHLENNLKCLDYYEKALKFLPVLGRLREDDERIILPFLWE